MDNHQEDAHFLIDNVSPRELEYTLRALDFQYPKNLEILSEELFSNWGYSVQSHFSNTTRRLLDLNLINRADDKKSSFLLTPLGIKLRQILDTSPVLYSDLVHFLHYTGSPKIRKYFLSYKWCCQILWERQELLGSQEIAAIIQSKIEEEYPQFYQQKTGGNFNPGGVSAWKIWISNLEPGLFGTENSKSKQITLRNITDFQLVLLSLNYLYTDRGYRYGDPVLIDEEIINNLSEVFFLELNCCRSLITLAAKLPPGITLRESLAGTTVTLQKPFTILNL